MYIINILLSRREVSTIKALLINGSPRKNGNTEWLLNYCCEQLISNKVEAEVINLASKEIMHCLGCGGCSGKNKCVINDDFNNIYQKVLSSGGIVLGTPVYVAMPTSLILAFVQRLTMVSFTNNNTLTNKVGGIIAVGGEAGQVAAINDLSNFFLVNGMALIGSNYWNIGVASKKGDIKKDENCKKYINSFVSNLKNYI